MTVKWCWILCPCDAGYMVLLALFKNWFNPPSSDKAPVILYHLCQQRPYHRSDIIGCILPKLLLYVQYPCAAVSHIHPPHATPPSRHLAPLLMTTPQIKHYWADFAHTCSVCLNVYNYSLSSYPTISTSPHTPIYDAFRSLTLWKEFSSNSKHKYMFPSINE